MVFSSVSPFHILRIGILFAWFSEKKLKKKNSIKMYNNKSNNGRLKVILTQCYTMMMLPYQQPLCFRRTIK